MKSVIAESLHFNQILIVKFERSCSGVQNLKLHKLCLCPVNYERFRCQELFGLLSSNTSQSSLNVSLLFHLSVCCAIRDLHLPIEAPLFRFSVLLFRLRLFVSPGQWYGPCAWMWCREIYIERDRTEQNGWSLHLESKVFLTKLHGNEI